MRRCPERVGLSSEAQEADVAVTRPGREVTVPLTGRDRRVPEPPLHHTQGRAARDEDARERVPQPVPGDTAQPGPSLVAPEQLMPGNSGNEDRGCGRTPRPPENRNQSRVTRAAPTNARLANGDRGASSILFSAPTGA